jgi:hypothetical protein
MRSTMPQVTALVPQVLEFAAPMISRTFPPAEREEAATVVAAHLAQPAIGWAVGTVGAIAEFMRAPTDDVEADCPTSVVTGRGALRIEVTPETRIVRFACAGSNLSCIALCLPEARARLNGHATLTELGRDQRALRHGDRDAFLFDLGICSPFFDFCIRTSDEDAVRYLRKQAGTALFTDGLALLAEIAAMQPHRIVSSRLARIEVYQPIAAPGETTPDGPHTHLLPQLLASGLTHAAEEPIPRGWIPCVHLYLGQLPDHEEHAPHRAH